MANAQRSNPLDPQRTGIFPPSLFDDPDAIAQIAGVENQPGPQPETQVAPGTVTGLVPKTFTEYAADPMNVNKVPPPISPNTPMPTLAAKAITTAISAPPAPVPSAPVPFSPEVQGAPDSADLFPGTDFSLQQPKTGPGLMANATAQPAATPAPASAAAAPAVPTGPLSKADFLAQNPVQVPGRPYVPQGKKLALTGLFAALDNAGAFLDHGQPSVGPGLIHNVQAAQEYDTNLPALQLQAENAAYDEYLKNYGAVRQNTLSPVTTIGPDGRPMTTYVDPKTQSTLLGANARAGASQNVAHIKADNATQLAQFKEMLNAGKVAFTKPTVDDKGNAVWGAYDKYGQLITTLDKSVGPAWLQPTVRTSVQVKENQFGGYDYIPVTSTTRRVFPGANGAAPAAASGGTRRLGQPPTSVTPNAPAAAPPAPAAVAPAAPNAAATPRQPLTPPARGGATPVPASAVHPVMGATGNQEFGKTGGDTGYAVDPKTGNTVLTTRAESGQNGLQDFRKVSQGDIDKDRQLVNRLADVETKLDRYQSAISDPGISDHDRAEIDNIIRSDKFKVGAFGAEIPVDNFNLWARENHLDNMSPAALKLVAAYYNARESMSGYQRVLSGSNRGSDKIMELNIDSLPKPSDRLDFAKEALTQFKENIPIMKRGLPVLPGVNDGPGGNGPKAAPGQPQSGANFFAQFGGKAH